MKPGYLAAYRQADRWVIREIASIEGAIATFYPPIQTEAAMQCI